MTTTQTTTAPAAERVGDAAPTPVPAARRSSVRRWISAGVLAAVLIPGLAACNVPFVGGGTSCKDFLNASHAEQTSIATKAFPHAGPLDDPIDSIGFYCSTHPTGSVDDIAPSS